MRLNNILLILFGGAIILHLFSLITIPSLYKEDTKYNKLLQEHDSIVNLYNNISNEYNKYKNTSDSIIAYYNNKYDSTKQANNNIIKSYEEKIKELDNITVVSNDSVTEYISKRIHNR